MPRAKVKKKPPLTVVPPTQQRVHDRRANELPINAQVAVSRERDAFGFPIGAVWDGAKGGWHVPDYETVNVVVSLRDDPLRQLLVRDQITRIQFEGGRWYQARYESQLGSVRAIDPSKEAVDGGGLPEVLTENLQASLQDLNRAAKALGLEGEAICRGIIGKGLTIGQFAASRGMSSRAEVEYVGKRFRECLNTLAGLANLVVQPPNQKAG